jgi:uncharacterized protein YhaN
MCAISPVRCGKDGGRLARRDVEIHRDEVWSVEARAGGPEGESKRFTVSGETEAKEIAEQLMQSEDR